MLVRCRVRGQFEWGWAGGGSQPQCSATSNARDPAPYTPYLSGFLGLDASRTWLCYWILHGLVLLERPFPAQPDRDSIITFLASCQDPEGGFGGGPYQLPHLAPTYAGG